MKRIFCCLICISLFLFCACSNKVEEKSNEIIIENVESDNEVDNVYYYNFISSIEQKYYDLFLKASRNNENHIIGDFEFNKDELSNALYAFCYDWPIYYYWRSGLNTEYNSNEFKSTCVEPIENITENIAKIENISIDELKDDNNYITIKNIHDYLVNSIDYCIDGEQSRNIYGALINHNATCDGYALAFKYLCNRAGFNCIVVDGQAVDKNGLVEHAWNKIELNGEWYNVDVTWDESVYLNQQNEVSYDYFLIDDEMINIDHFINENYIYPECNKSLFYINLPGLYCDNYDKEVIKSFLKEWLKASRNDFYIRFKNNEDGEKAHNWLFESKGFSEIYNECGMGSGKYEYGYEYNPVSHILHAFYSKID